MTAKPISQESLGTLARRVGALYTGAIVDVLDEMGLKHQALPPTIAPLQRGMTVAGPAFPIEGTARANMEFEESMTSILTMLGEVPSAYVCVYQTRDDTCSHLGELSVTALKARGCAGAIIDGGCRDIRHILREEFPVFCRYTSPVDAVGRWEVTSFGHEISVGGVRVGLADYVVADFDGVVIIPGELRFEVLERAEAVAQTENHVRRAIREGMSPLDAYRRFGRF